jgi:hypothetical protein
MVQVEVTVTFEGKRYLTNVITNRSTSEAEIFRLALEQVEKQWKKKSAGALVSDVRASL